MQTGLIFLQTQHKLVVQLHEQYSTINVIHVGKICKCTLKILLFPDFFQRLKFSLTRSEILNFFCSSPITSLWPNSQSFTTCGGMKVHDSLRQFFYSHSQSIPVHAHVVKNELIRSLKPQNYKELSSKSKTLESHLKIKLWESIS